MNKNKNNHKQPNSFLGINQTWQSYLAILVIYAMVLPIFGKYSPVSDAHADGPNFSCEFIGVQQPDGSFGFNPDPNDPDCFSSGLTAKQNCSCSDGTTVVADLNASCNTSATCQSHGGECTLLSCYKLINTEAEIVLGGLEYFNNDSTSLNVFAFDPDTNQLVLNQTVNAISSLFNIGFVAETEVLAAHGLPESDRSLLRTWGRDRVRAQIMTDFVNVIAKDAATRTPYETNLYDWLTALVWKKRILYAQSAWDQYRSWKYAVDFAKCDWHSPSKDGIVTLTTTNGVVGNKAAPGCSAGVDGIPGNDPTPNSGSIQDLLDGRDDGETCFAFPKSSTFQATTPPVGDTETMSYDAITQSRCAGASPIFDVSLAAHPPIEDFLRYGLALSRKNEIITPGFASTLGNAYKDEAFGIGIGVAGLAGAGTAAAVYAKGGWQFYSKVIAPFVGRAKLAVDGVRVAVVTARIASTVAAAFIVTEIIGNTVTAVLTLLDIIEFNDLPVKLKAFVRAAYGATETTVKFSENYSLITGKPNLQSLINTNDGKDEIRFALVEAMSPEIDLSAATALADNPDQFWAQTRLSGTPVTSSPLTHSLVLRGWEGSKPFDDQAIGLAGGWFTSQIESATVVRSMDLGLDYKDCNGKERRLWRVGGDEFVSMPMGKTATDFDLTTTTKSKEFQYLSSDPSLGCLTARINHAPTATGITVNGTLTEGQQATFSGTASDPDGDAVNLLAWNFGDGTSPASGSPVQHNFADSGSLQVTLMPTDVFAMPGSAKTQLITVNNVAPTASLASSAPVDEGGHFSMILNNPSDPSPKDTEAGFQYAFNCGSGFGDFSGSPAINCPPTTDSGNIAIAAKIKDKDGGENTYSGTAVVNNLPPVGVLSFSGIVVPEGSSPALGFSLVSDPSTVDRQTLQFAFDCGSGFGAYGSTNGGACPTLDNGFLNAVGRIKDKDGGIAERTAGIIVTNVASTATFKAKEQIFQGEAANLVFSEQQDPSSVDKAAGFTYAYNCSASGTLAVANDRAALATCKFSSTGTFTVGGTIRDKDNGASSYTASVRVLSPKQAASNLKAIVKGHNLGATQTGDLTGNINSALQLLDQGNKVEAQNQLQSFISKVRNIIKQKLITTDIGWPMINKAKRIIAAISVS